MKKLQKIWRPSGALAAALLVVLGAHAQAPGQEFPSDAVALTPESLQGLANKQFVGKRADGTGWTMDFGADYQYRLSYRRGGVGAGPGGGVLDGKVRLEETRLCQDMRKTVESSCNEVRMKGDTLFYMRPNGEVVVLVKQ